MLPKRQGGERIGDGQCVSLVKDATDFKGTAHEDWIAGPKLSKMDELDKLAPGTAIAIFGDDGKYHNTHAAIYLGYSENPRGIRVLDQWRGAGGEPAERFYPFKPAPGRSRMSDASRYSVITVK
jgi:hypothetical protein